MKLRMMSMLSVLLLASCLTASINADEYESRDGSCCRLFSNQYECGCNPLYCGAFDLQVHGGVRPIIWTDRGMFSAVICPLGAAATDPVVDIFKLPRQRKLFRIPWEIGGQVGYHISENMRLFVEFNYGQASGKSAVVFTPPPAVLLSVFSFSLSKYKFFDAYLGGQYYWDRWCDSLALFVGAKIGLIHRKNVAFTLDVTTPLATTLVGTTPATYFISRSNRVSGGAQIGLDYCICGNWSLQLVGEFVASCGPRTNPNIVINNGTSITNDDTIINNILIGRIGTEISFPITVAARYSF